jgi:hypothetical protein
MLNLMKLFHGYVRNYHTLNLTETHGRHSFTMAEIEYFFRLGSMLGYHAFTEDTCDGTYRPMDLTWWDDLDGEGWNRLVLHLERENTFHKDEETLKKLFGQREIMPENVIGIMNVSDHERMQHLISVATRTCPIRNSLLIFRTYSPDKPLPYFDNVYAYLLNQHEVKDSKQARISLIGSTFFMQLVEDTDDW